MEVDRRKVAVGEAEGWVVPMRPALVESAYAPNAAGKQRIQPDSPAISRNVPTVAQPWCGVDTNRKKKGGGWSCHEEMEQDLSVSDR